MRILIVEDDIKIAKSIRLGLEQEGYAIDVANDGIYGYDLASTTPYDLLILDLMLPGLSGEEICRKLREVNNSTPVLMLTAKSEIGDKVNGLGLGADDYMTKPFSFEELLARIRALLRRPRSLTPNILTCGELKVNLSTYEVIRSGTSVSLTKKEFALLEYMIKNKNRILKKEDIIEHVWNFDADILPNTVEVYIGYLRGKIDKPFLKEKPLIRTLWGFGYKLEE